MVESADFINAISAMPGVGWSPTWGTSEATQVLLADVPGSFSWDFPLFAQPTDWPVSYKQK